MKHKFIFNLITVLLLTVLFSCSGNPPADYGKGAPAPKKNSVTTTSIPITMERTFIMGTDNVGLLGDITFNPGDTLIWHFDWTNYGAQYFGIGFSTPGDLPDLSPSDISNFEGSLSREDGKQAWHLEGSLKWISNFDNVDICRGHVWTLKLIHSGSATKTWKLRAQIEGIF